MKEKSSASAAAPAVESSSSSSSSAVTATAGNTSATNSNNSSSSSSAQSDITKKITDPYNSSNFMAPPVGGTIKCVTCLGTNVQGKVIAYDQQTKMLALRSNVPNKPGFYDYSMINVAWCSNLEVIEEPSETPEPLPNLNIQKLERRKKLNIENKYKEINSLGQDVTPFAQNLYYTIYKTLNEVEWEGKNIVVMNSVVISPPYDVTSCHGRNGDNHQAVEHVKKIVKKLNEDLIDSANSNSNN